MHQKEFISAKVKAAWHFPRVYFSVTMAALTLLWLGYLSFAQEQRGLVVSPKSAASAWGNYWALIVGIDQYQEWPRLETAVNDARGLKALLESQYGFPPRQVVLLVDPDPTLSNLTRQLRQMAQRLGPDDNWLIYFAGHGQIDELTGDGYWIPLDGKLKDSATWLDHSRVKLILGSEKVRGRSICVVADSCYAGTLLRGGPAALDLADQRYQEKLRELAVRKSRQVITSGGKEPVVDGGRDNHSLFAYYFLRALRENSQSVIDLENLFHTRVWKPVTEISGQRPAMGRLRTPMDEDGQFVLVRGAAGGASSESPAAPAPITVDRQPLFGSLAITANRSGAQLYLNGQSIGQTEAGTRLRFRNIPVGEHTLSASVNNKEVWRRSIRVEEATEAGINLDLPDSAFRLPFEPDMVFIRGGAFRMGSEKGLDDEKPVHPVTVGDFYIGKYEVTNAEFAAFISDTGYGTEAEKRGSSAVLRGETWSSVQGADWKHPDGPGSSIEVKGRYPVVQVSWNDARAYCQWLAQKTGKTYRLSTEAEWEYACRAGTTSEYWWGDTFDRTRANSASYWAGFEVASSEAWKRWRSQEKRNLLLTEVGTFPTNPWGLYDMLGNVWEWSSSRNAPYPYRPDDGREVPIAAGESAAAVLRGGSWYHYERNLRSANRYWNYPTYCHVLVGFRCAR